MVTEEARFPARGHPAEVCPWARRSTSQPGLSFLGCKSLNPKPFGLASHPGLGPRGPYSFGKPREGPGMGYGPHSLPAGPHASVTGFGAKAGSQVPMATHQEDLGATRARVAAFVCKHPAGAAVSTEHGKGRGLNGGGVSGAAPGDSGGACCWEAFRAHRSSPSPLIRHLSHAIPPLPRLDCLPLLSRE